MNKPNPLVPQGTFADKGKAHIRNTVFVILAGHVVLLVGLLFAGCNKKDAEAAANDVPQTPTAMTGPSDPNSWAPAPPPATQTLPVSTPTPPVGTPTTTLPIAATPTTTTTPTPTGLTPPPPGLVDPPVANGLTEHTVLKNETFSSIGQKYKVGYQAIAAANPGVDPSKLKIGQKINIPPARTLVANARPLTAPVGTEVNGDKIHVVKSGDRLYDLAKTYGVTVKQIQTANHLPTTQIRVGQKLKIPSKAPPPIDATTPPAAPPPATPALPTDTFAPAPTGTAPR